VNRLAPEKGPRGASSLKWKNAKAKRCRAPVDSSALNSSPVMVSMIKEHQAAVKKKKPRVKRLRKKAKTLEPSGTKKRTPTSYEREKSYPITTATTTNGGLAVKMMNDNGSKDWREWGANGGTTIVGNGTKSAAVAVETEISGRLEGDSLHYCAERDEERNHAVLVMQKAQVCHAD